MNKIKQTCKFMGVNCTHVKVKLQHQEGGKPEPDPSVGATTGGGGLAHTSKFTQTGLLYL